MEMKSFIWGAEAPFDVQNETHMKFKFRGRGPIRWKQS